MGLNVSIDHKTDNSISGFELIATLVSIERVTPFINIKVRPHCALHSISQTNTGVEDRVKDSSQTGKAATFSIIGEICKKYRLTAQALYYLLAFVPLNVTP